MRVGDFRTCVGCKDKKCILQITGSFNSKIVKELGVPIDEQTEPLNVLKPTLGVKCRVVSSNLRKSTIEEI